VRGFLNLNKPSGWTSHDCVAKLRRRLQTKRIGHGGTLDPAATGVLPIAVGSLTRLLQYLPEDKAYRGVLRFGVTTTTDDMEGEVLSQESAAAIDLAQIEAALPQFVGTIHQIPPRYSAIQVDGQRLYDLARRGEVFEVPSRTVVIRGLEILHWEPGPEAKLTLAIDCGPGTYIRSIARDLGAALGVGGSLDSLVRTRSCGFDLAESLDLEAIVDGADPRLIDGNTALQHLPILQLEDELCWRWRNGQKLPGPWLERVGLEWPDLSWTGQGPEDVVAIETGPLRIQSLDGSLLGVATVRQDETELLIPKLVLPPID
jgi:tRNA pseudouridine55 synthase